MRLSQWTSIVVAFVTQSVAVPADALPSFARKHGMVCSECHAIYPKLTPVGRRFKESGYRLPDDESSWRDLLRSFPGSIRVGFQSYLKTAELGPFPADTFGPTMGTLKPISAGGGSSWISFWVDWPIEFSTDELEAVRREHYWVRVNDVLRTILPDLLSVKGGQFELDLPFPQSRSYNLFPYAPYQLTGSYQESIAAPHRGMELSGSLGRGFRYSLAVADILENPSSERDTVITTNEDPFDPDLYLRVSKTFRNVDRIGFFLYLTDNNEYTRTVELIQWNFTFPFDIEIDSRYEAELLGTDADCHLGDQRFNVYGLFLLGRKNRTIALLPWEEEYFFGGFAQFDTRLLKSLTLVARYSWIRSEVEMLSRWFDEFARLRRDDRHEVTLGTHW